MKDLDSDLESCVDPRGFVTDPYGNNINHGYTFGRVACDVVERIHKVHSQRHPECGAPMNTNSVY